MLKKLLFTIVTTLLIVVNINAQSDTDVLITVGDSEVTVGEFKYIYEKNNGKTADYTQASLEEYIDLYTKFKLKVQKAKEMKLDTIVSLQKELDGYRSQLASSFLTDKEVFGKLISEIYQRKKEDVKIRHILLQAKSHGPNKHKSAAKNQLQNIKEQLKAGKSFSAMAKQFSQDKNTSKLGGSMGFLTAMLPSGFYELENAMYDLKPGEVSEPIETKLGFHLIKVDKKRPARGVLQVAHIFKKIDKTKPGDAVKVNKLLDSLYLVLQNGGDFAKLTMQYSDDKSTASKAGLLPPFGIGVYDIKFENEAFALQNDGNISKPIVTSAGMHILKRMDKQKPNTKEQLSQKYKQKIKKYDRYAIAQDNMINRIKSASKFIEHKNVLSNFANSLDKEFYSYKWKPSKILSKDLLLAFGNDAKFTISDFAAYAKKQTRSRSQFDKTKPVKEAVDDIYSEFVKAKAYEYEQKNLEDKYPEFKALMREYSEGILLFEATKINVWDKANQDTVGLYSFYEQNKSKYIFEKQAKIGKYIINTTEKNVVNKIKKCAKKHDIQKTMKRFNKDGVELIEYSEMTVEPGSKELVGLNYKKKSVSETIFDEKSKKSSFKKVIEILPSRRKSLKEARGYVVADYQDLLDRTWINKLKKEYKVKVAKNILSRLIKK
ncbi:MAG: peptidylprolyl isomerase [Saprospiraceae bacterium]